MELTERFNAALVFALERHRHQFRKGTNEVPYATHLLAVASLVGEYGGDEEQMMAALLHDVIEDQDVTPKELAERFGERVAGIVVDCTDAFTTPKPAWRGRKEAYLAALVDKAPSVKLVSACDKLHNATSIGRDLRRPEVGEAIWSRFSVPKAETLWYYRAIVRALSRGWDHPVLVELDEVVSRLERGA